MMGLTAQLDSLKPQSGYLEASLGGNGCSSSIVTRSSDYSALRLFLKVSRACGPSRWSMGCVTFLQYHSRLVLRLWVMCIIQQRYYPHPFVFQIDILIPKTMELRANQIVWSCCKYYYRKRNIHVSTASGAPAINPTCTNRATGLHLALYIPGVLSELIKDKPANIIHCQATSWSHNKDF